MEQQKIDLDALEAALARYGDYTPLDIKFALPALIAELRQLRARTAPEPIGEKHKDGNWWLCWEPGYKVWFKLRWRCEGWQLAACNFIGTPTHALPLPPAPEAQ